MRNLGIEQMDNREMLAANVLSAFTPFGGFHGGLSVAVGDVNGDGQTGITSFKFAHLAPSDPSGNTYYFGTANGGVWKTTNF